MIDNVTLCFLFEVGNSVLGHRFFLYFIDGTLSNKKVYIY